MNDLRNLSVRAGRISNVFALRDGAVTHFRQQVMQTRITLENIPGEKSLS